MASFGIVAEGITDQIVIENILRGWFCGEGDEPDVRYVQPIVDETGRKGQPEPGGWTLIWRFLERGDHKAALQYNDYLVLQVDTDVCEDVGYDVPKRESGRELAAEELRERVVTKLVSLIGAELYARHRERFIFAVCVHQLECWLLPIVFPDKKQKAAKITGCIAAVDDELKAQGKRRLKRGADGKDPEGYREVSSHYASSKVLRRACEKNPSLQSFVARLKEIEDGGG